MRLRISRFTPVAALLLVGGCHAKPADTAASARQAAADAAADSAAAAADAGPGCPVTGRWAECSALKRLDEAGLVVAKDSALARQPALSKPGILLHPAHGDLQLFFYRDTAQRKLDEAKLDRKTYIDLADEPTFRNEWTIIRAWNMLGLLRIADRAERERIWDALMAGPPQPSKAPPS